MVSWYVNRLLCQTSRGMKSWVVITQRPFSCNTYSNWQKATGTTSNSRGRPEVRSTQVMVLQYTCFMYSKVMYPQRILFYAGVPQGIMIQHQRLYSIRGPSFDMLGGICFFRGTRIFFLRYPRAEIFFLRFLVD